MLQHILCEKCVARQPEQGWHLSYPSLCSTSENSLGQEHLAAKVGWKRCLITHKGEMGELWEKKLQLVTLYRGSLF